MNITNISNRLETADDAEAFIRGLTVFGTGGGGSPAVGRKLLSALVKEGIEIGWVSDEDLPDSLMTCSVFGMGSIAPHEPMSLEERVKAGYPELMEPYPAVRAVERLSSYLASDIKAIIAFESGPMNTVMAMDTALRLGISMIDGDYVGRATPEMAQGLPVAYGVKCYPVAVCDPWGVRVVIEETPSPAITERLGKAISTVTLVPDAVALCAHASFAQTVVDARRMLVRGTLTRALRVGRALLDAERTGKDVLKSAADAAGGAVMFRGSVTKKDWEDSAGYMVGTTYVDGEKEFSGHEARVWFKNENHVLWIDDSVRLTSPDLICVINSKDAVTHTNTELQVGEQVGVIGLAADERLRGDPGLELSTPEHYGLAIPYVPFV